MVPPAAHSIVGFFDHRWRSFLVETRAWGWADSLTTSRTIHSFLNNVGEGNRLEGTFPNESHPQFPPSAPVGTCEFWEVSLETLWCFRRTR